jgi:hypothetical protein
MQFVLTFVDFYGAVVESVNLNHGQKERRAVAGQFVTACLIRHSNVTMSRNRWRPVHCSAVQTLLQNT